MPRAHGVSPKQPYWITLEGFSFLDDCAVSLSGTSPWHIRLGRSLLRLNSDRTRKEAAVKACVTLHGRSSCGCSGTIIECYEVGRGSWFNWATNNTSVSATSLDKKKFQPTHVPHNRACLIPAQWIFHSNSVYWCCSENDRLWCIEIAQEVFMTWRNLDVMFVCLPSSVHSPKYYGTDSDSARNLRSCCWFGLNDMSP